MSALPTSSGHFLLAIARMAGTANPQDFEVSTVRDNSSIQFENGSQGEVETYSQGTFLIVIQVLVGSLTLFGNLLLIRVLHDLPNSKLRKTTKLLLSYVSVSFCIFSIAMLGRVLKLPCSVFKGVVATTGFHALGGMLCLALETFFIVNRPHTQHKFVSMRKCKLAILLYFLLSVIIDLIAFVTRRKVNNTSVCNMTDGRLNPVFVSFTSGCLLVMIISTAVIQCKTVQRLKTVSPVRTQPNYTVSFHNSNMAAVPTPVISLETTPVSVSKSPLHKLTIMLSLSLLCFIICWTPLIMCFLVFPLCDLVGINIELKHEISLALSSLVMFNGSLHVTIYLSRSTQIRQTVIKYFKRCFC